MADDNPKKQEPGNLDRSTPEADDRREGGTGYEPAYRDASEKPGGRYILTYSGSRDEFENEYLDILLKNSFEPVRYIPLTGKTIIFIDDVAGGAEGTGGSNDTVPCLEDRLKLLYSDKLSVEEDRIYRINK